MERAAGVLLHPTCLPGSFGIGDIGPQAERFISWLADAGQTYWQILPLGPVDDSGSPYRSFSAFAGNPLLISPQRLARSGMLAEEDLEAARQDSRSVDFAAVDRSKGRLLRAAWKHRQTAWTPTIEARFEEFCGHDDVRAWLDDWALFAALKLRYDGAPWYEWPDDVRRRHDRALQRVRTELAAEIEFHRFEQFLFFDQWDQLRSIADRQGIRLLGDLAIYVAPDSADVWSNQEMFDLAPNGTPRAVAGVPPDYFSETGQRWGNPLYSWDRLKRSGFGWWIERLRWSLRQVDLLRLDHFRGFAAYWEVPASEETAIRGEWRPGPGIALFEAARQALGELPLIAEDLGVITEDVSELRQNAGLPGMRVLQFAFAEPSSDHLPHRISKDTVLYTGTHDNQTSRGWLESAAARERQRALDYLGGSSADISWSLIRAAYTSVAETVVTPLQDVLELADDARLNTPGEPAGQWSWRLSELPGRQRAERLRRLAEVTDRLQRGGEPATDRS